MIHCMAGHASVFGQELDHGSLPFVLLRWFRSFSGTRNGSIGLIPSRRLRKDTIRETLQH